MEKAKPLLMLFLGCLFCFLQCHPLPQTHGLLPSAAIVGGGDDHSRPKTYIVYVKKPEHLLFGSHEEREEWHKSFLPSTTLDSGEPRLVYSYEHAISGFAARLTPDEVKAMEGVDGFLYARPDEQLKPRTTYTHRFLGLSRSGGLWVGTRKGAGMIIGVMERGFVVDHPSFKGDGMAAPPSRWKGRCDFEAALCNNKLIGTRVFNSSGEPYDRQDASHGTHVASVAAGNRVFGAHTGGACGTAIGVAPRAHLAFYVVGGVADWLKGVDQAIKDGIDVLSVSMGVPEAKPFYADPLAVGALSAVRHGIFVSVSAGNDGPDRGSMLNNEPWTLTVGASTTDRAVRVNLRLGDGRVIPGESPMWEYFFPPLGTVLPAVFPGGTTGNSSVKNCAGTDFGGIDVSGKIVLCLRKHETGSSDYNRTCNVGRAGGELTVLMNKMVQGATISYNGIFCGTAVLVDYNESKRLKTYVKSARNPTISIEPVGTVFGLPRHPAVAHFSSRGPSPVNMGILKPDILGPGVSIIGAYGKDPRFLFWPGTSMACPHLSGIAAMLKSSHPDWTPAMIKSAIMTTSDRLDNTGRPIADETGNRANLFATGAGHVNPTSANDPGLVYDIEYEEYVRYVCGLGYSPWQVDAVVGGGADCSKVGSITAEQVNYPSFSVSVTSAEKNVSRTVTNVGPAVATYTLSLERPADVRVVVRPAELNFASTKEKKTYTVTLASTNPGRTPGDTEDGQLLWISSTTHHVVRSPISVTFA